MEKIATVGLDLAKTIFQVHAINDAGVPIVRRALRRSQVLAFFGKLPPCVVGMEACGSAHFWAREIKALGHDVRMMPPIYVKAYGGRRSDLRGGDAPDDAFRADQDGRPTRRRHDIEDA